MWKERNSKVFDGAQHSGEEVFDLMRDEISVWRAAGRVTAIAWVLG
jgi:hypothetical protein